MLYRVLANKMYYVIPSMLLILLANRAVKARVRCGNGEGLTHFFYQKGWKQGEIISPLLFSLLINELPPDIMNNGKHGVQLHPNCSLNCSS